MKSPYPKKFLEDKKDPDIEDIEIISFKKNSEIDDA